MDIGREVRRYRAEPLTSPVPGEAPAPVEQAPAPAPTRPVAETADDTPRTREAAEAHA